MQKPTFCCDSCRDALLGIFSSDFPADHGLHGVLNQTALKPYYIRFVAHTLCLYMNLKDHLKTAYECADLELHLRRLRTKAAGYPAEESWVAAYFHSDTFEAVLEEECPWLRDEVTLILKSLLSIKGLITINTVAPEQLLFEWYLAKFSQGMDILYRAHGDEPPTATEPFQDLLKTSIEKLKRGESTTFAV